MCAPIEYRTDLVLGQKHFACVAMHATLDTASCANRWKRSMEPDAERLVLCRRCPIGRQHHAEHHPDDAATPLHPTRAQLCIRCGRPATRMVGNIHCPSCWNRAAEWRKQKNSRGNFPVTYIPAKPHRVGVLDNDGKPGWRLFDGQHHAESMALATRAGLRLSPAQPGSTHWNAGRQAFEYRDEAGRVLIDLEIDGRVEYVGVEQLHQGEQPAAVTMRTQLLTPDEAALWLEISGEGDELGVYWRQTSFACGKCGQGMVHAYRALDGIHARCSAGCC